VAPEPARRPAREDGAPMDDALRDYGSGHADGLAGKAGDGPAENVDYRTGLADGQLAKFENDLVAAIREALGGEPR
jgi:hypothetical protein